MGVRDLARELGLSPGNLSYHFATKEALIAELVEEAHATNNAVATPSGPLDFIQLDRVVRNIMQRDIEHLWFTRNAPELVLSLPTLRQQHERMQRAREGRVDRVIAHLVDARMLDGERTDRALLRLQVLTQIFFWVPAALLAAPDNDPAERLDLHARAALALFEVYATPVGRRQLAPLLAAPRKSRRRHPASTRRKNGA